MSIGKFLSDPTGFSPFESNWLNTLITWVAIPALLYTTVLVSSKWFRLTRSGELHSGGSSANEVVLVVLGDLGQSPRMTYHAHSFLKLGYFVNICGYLETQVPYSLYNPNVSINEIPVIHNTSDWPFAVFAAYKVTMQLYELFRVLTSVIDDNTKYVVIQNPPCLPLLAVLAFLKLTLAPHIKIIVDWHNLNYTILNLKYNNLKHPFVRFMKAYERILSKHSADLNLTVTEAMKNYLIDDFGLDPQKVVTVYDRPTDIFEPLKDEKEFNQIVANNPDVFAEIKPTEKILVTSTSFTADEDFGVLVEALKLLNGMLVEAKSKETVRMVVTGKGPLKQDFLDSIYEHKWQKVLIKDAWLPIVEYPNVLKASNLGISLHYSSSGLDLPMKIVDLFGSGVPVVSMGYPVISELVKDGTNGLLLKDNHSGEELASKIYGVLFDDNKLYNKLKAGAMKESKWRWDEEWDSKLGQRLAISK